MNRKILIILFIIVHFTFNIVLKAQETWIKTYRPFQRQYWTDSYTVEDVVVTQDGGYVVSGGYELFGDMPWDYEKWGFLMKTDSDGNILWAVNDSVEFMSNNGYDIDFTELLDGSLLSIGFQGYGGSRYMIKRDSQGNREWAIPYNTDFGVFSMKTTNDGNVILGGRAEYNAALRKITPFGETLWTNIIDLDSSIVFSVTQSSDYGYLLTGKKYSDDNDILVIKTDSNGDSLWTRTFDGLGGNDKGNCVIETFDGNLLVGGWLYDEGYFGFIWKLNQFGDTIYTEIFDEEVLNAIGSLIQSFDNNYVLQGSKLVKIDDNQNVIWNEPLTGDVFGGGDKNLQEIQNSGFICVSTEDYGDHIVLNKTDSLGQITAIVNNEIIIKNSQLICYPNPFNPETKISFNLPANIENPIIEIFNIKGEKIKTFNCQNQMPLIWDGTDNFSKQVSSGIYLYRLKADHYVSKAKKMTLIK